MAAGDPAALSGEDRLIEAYFASLPLHPGALGLRDDAAMLTPPDGCDLVLTKDVLVADVHFFADDPPDLVAKKALRVNLSDLAAKGAEPAGFLLGIALPDGVSADWLAAFSRGLAEDARAFGCPLFGGDTVRSTGPVMLSVTAIGSLPKGTMVHRFGARAGDKVFVSGTIGDAAIGLRLRKQPVSALSADEQGFLSERYLLPQPRNALASAIRTSASAAMDVSDGLVGDLAKLCRVSGVSADIEIGRVPLSGATQAAIAGDNSLLPVALTGGDDYEILCTVPAGKAELFLCAAEQARVAMTEIGVMTEGQAAPRLVGPDGVTMTFAHGSFSHF